MFTSATFDFLRDLRAHNDRAWFEANRARWEAHGKAPMAAFVEAFRPRLHAISPRFVADARSVFRIHRDVRFSADKSPYKTHLGVQFQHEAVKGAASERVHAPGFYLHVAPDGPGEMEGVFGGFGMWQPPSEALARVRARMVAEPGAWSAATAGLTLGGSSLKRVPPGYAADHPLADALRLKDYVVMTGFTEDDAARPDFVDRYAEACRRAAPLQRFLCEAVGLPF